MRNSDWSSDVCSSDRDHDPRAQARRTRAGQGQPMIAIDTPALIDLLADGPDADAVELCLRPCLGSGPVVVCDVVLAELCGALKDGSEALAVLEERSIRYLPTEERRSAV